MSTVHADRLDHHDDPTPEPLGLAPEPVEIRRNAGLAALVGAVASAVAIAYLARATGTGSVLDWTLFAVMGVLGVSNLAALVDARTPLLVADSQGVRIRLGRTWRGMPWGALARVEHTPRRGPFHDGRLVLVAHAPDRVLGELDASGRRQSRLAEKLYGAPFAVPLALSTRVTGAGEDLTDALARLAGSASAVVEIEPQVDEAVDELEDDLLEDDVLDEHDAEPESWHDSEVDVDVDEHDEEWLDEPRTRAWHDPRPALAHGIGVLSAALQRRREAIGAEPEVAPALRAEHDEVGEPTVAMPIIASATPSPLRDPVTAIRAEIRSDLTLGGPVLGATALAHDHADDEDGSRRELPEARELRRPGSVNLVEDTVLWGDRVRPIARAGASVEPIVIDDFSAEPAEDPIIGPEFAAARTRLGLTVDQLADRTRIRPHVIESIEVDDFVPCGGDFYARGHLRTLARVLGIDVAPLLTSYDERYADAPINPRRVFEAELATGAHGSIRGTRGGPNWSVLVAAVMAVVLVWSIARLVMDSPVELRQQAPILNGSNGPDNTLNMLGDPVPVVLTAKAGGAHVVVYDGAGEVAFRGDLAYGESREVKGVAPPVRVQSSDGALEVEVDGTSRGAVGAEGQPAQNTFTVRKDGS
ncbi:helix-turn-helix domain-containing protein [Nocardioides luti]|uniref:helix-turn-helix domain-containing protein n=1 Tax=Nocardioides luti TaxID=2761101 RepID=UPI001C8AB469